MQRLNIVSYSKHTTAQRPPAGMAWRTNLFVSGLPFNVTEDQIRAMFSEFGTIRSILVKNPLQPQNEVVKSISPLIAN